MNTACKRILIILSGCFLLWLPLRQTYENWYHFRTARDTLQLLRTLANWQQEIPSTTAEKYEWAPSAYIHHNRSYNTGEGTFHFFTQKDLSYIVIFPTSVGHTRLPYGLVVQKNPAKAYCVAYRHSPRAKKLCKKLGADVSTPITIELGKRWEFPLYNFYVLPNWSAVTPFIS